MWFLFGVKDRGIFGGPVFETVIRKKEVMEAVVGDRIGGFVIKEIIHTGGWGNVYKVQPEGISQIYALKMATSADSQRRLHTEREVLDKIGEHKNITKIYFCGNDTSAGDYDNGPMLPSGERADGDGFFYIVEEYATTNLRKKLDSWAKSSTDGLSFETCMDITTQILEGLRHAHNKSIIHQDLKPENILLSSTGIGSNKKWHVQLCDFGLAALPDDDDKLESSLDDTRAIAGSLHYLSPEQRSGKKIDRRTDLYNVGLILYEMLTHKRPTINLVKPTEVREKLLRSNKYATYSPYRPKELPVWADSLVLKALSAEPADRFKNAAEMLKFIDGKINPPKPKPVGSAILLCRSWYSPILPPPLIFTDPLKTAPRKRNTP